MNAVMECSTPPVSRNVLRRSGLDAKERTQPFRAESLPFPPAPVSFSLKEVAVFARLNTFSNRRQT